MSAYKADTAWYNIITVFYKGAKNNGRILLKEIFSSDDNMISDYQNNTLTIVLHSISIPRTNEAVIKLCELLNETQTIYPYSKLKLIFKTSAV